MDILLQSDGQLYPPRHAERRTKPEPKPMPKPAPAPEPKPEPKPEPPLCPAPLPEPPCHPAEQGHSWEELLILVVAIIVLKSGDKPDLPLLLALAYILFDNKFSLKGII